MAHRVPHSSWSRRTRCGTNEVREGAAITAAASKPAKRAETLSMQVNLLHRLHLLVVYLSLCMPSHPFHRQLHSYILCSSIQFVRTIILYSLLHYSIQKTSHESSNSAWHWFKSANWVLRSTLSQRTPCGQRSAGAAVRLAGLISPSFWSHQDSRENKSKAVEELILQLRVASRFSDNMMVHSSSLYVPTLLPYAGSTLNFFRRFSNILSPWLIMLSLQLRGTPAVTTDL